MAPTGALTPQQAGFNQIQFPKFSPNHQGMREDLIGKVQPGAMSGVDFLNKLAMGDQGTFDTLEAPALRQFGELQGRTSSRFSGLGMGARHSSGFQNTTGGQAQSLAEKLQSQRLGLQHGAIQQLLGLYGDLMEDPYDTEYGEDENDSWWRKLLRGGLPIAGGVAGGLIGGPGGAMLGSSIGASAGQAF